MAMRPPRCWFLNSSICSTAASKSSPVWTTRNRGRCSWCLLGSKSLAHDAEARIRKFADRRILASPSLSKILFPTSIIAKDCRWRTGPSQHARILILDRPIELRPAHFVICRSLGVEYFGFFSRWGSPLSWENGSSAYFFVKHLRDFMILDYPRYPYIPSVIGGCTGELPGFGVKPRLQKNRD